MPKNEDGEFELILGNRQLLSVFFIVVILLGVFFTMGYIVGRNSAPAPASGSRLGRKPEAKPMVVDFARAAIRRCRRPLRQAKLPRKPNPKSRPTQNR